MPSWVYIIVNEAAPGLLKVGFTNRTPAQRAQELGATGLPFPYSVVYEREVEDGRNTEQAAHLALAEFHVGKEWFRCSIETARKAIDQVESFGNDGSPLVPGHRLSPYLAVDREILRTRNESQNLIGLQDDEEDGETPLPPGHPLRGML